MTLARPPPDLQGELVYLDRKARELSVRVAYAGQPFSGKTQSIRALVPLLKGAAAGADILSPRESSGRTLYFDWASYRGGSVRGNQVCCQIVTVPGQTALVRRRQLLIESADVVIFVLDSDPARLPDGRTAYQEMQPWLRRSGRKPAPVVFQCNKRDLPSAATLERIRAELGLESGCPLIESAATSGRGIRSAFIAALRCASAYADELEDTDLKRSASHVDTGEQLFDLMQRLESAETVPDHTREEVPRVDPPVSTRAPEKVVGAEAHRTENPPQAQMGTQPAPPRQVVPDQVPGEASEQTRQRVARRWSGVGPRPAVMPAAEWRRLVPGGGSSIRPPELPISVTPVEHASAMPVERASVLHASEITHVRPAVMPSVAWLAGVGARGSVTLAEPTSAQATTTVSECTAGEGAVEDAVPPADAAATDNVTAATNAAPMLSVVPTLSAAPAQYATSAQGSTDTQVVVEESVATDTEVVLLPGLNQSLDDVWPIQLWKDIHSQLHQELKGTVCRGGVWTGQVAPKWTAESAALFGDHETGREALQREVQRREVLRQHLWPYRCLVLCPDGVGYWRLWELIRNPLSLNLILVRVLGPSAQSDPRQTAGNLVALARAYLRAAESLSAVNEPFEIGFGQIAQHEGRLVYTGFLHVSGMDARPRLGDAFASLEAQFRLYLPLKIDQAVDVAGICRALKDLEHSGASTQIVELLCGLLIAHQRGS